jgi:hypothetical protein
MGFFCFYFHFHFVHLERLKMFSFYQSPCENPKTNHVNSRIDKKMWKHIASVLSTMSSINEFVSHSHRIWTTRIKENNLKGQKMKKLAPLNR